MREQVEAAKKAVARQARLERQAQSNLGWEIIQSYIKDMWNKFPPEEQKAYGYNPAELKSWRRRPSTKSCSQSTAPSWRATTE